MDVISWQDKLVNWRTLAELTMKLKTLHLLYLSKLIVHFCITYRRDSTRLQFAKIHILDTEDECLLDCCTV